jgi:hypothetical protein
VDFGDDEPLRPVATPAWRLTDLHSAPLRR